VDLSYDVRIYRCGPSYLNIGEVRKARRQLSRRWARNPKETFRNAYSGYVAEHGFLVGDIYS
jgi:hypothetical protein